MEPNPKRIKLIDIDEEENGLRSPSHLVFDIVIRWTVNSPLDLMPLRLVNKAWNESICAASRSDSIVIIDEKNDSKIQEFVNLLKGRSVWVDGTSPLPFKRVQLVPCTFSEPNFMDFIQNYIQDFIVTEFTLEYEECTSKDEDFQNTVDQILTQHAEDITKLDIYRRWNSQFPPTNFNLEKIKFRNLKEMNIDFTENMETILEKTLAIGKLETFGIAFHDVGSVPLPTLKVLESVPSLRFKIVGSVKDFPFQKFAQLRLSNLKELHLISVPEAEVEVALEIISRWSESLEDIQFVLANIPLHRLPVFPKLRNMAFDDDYACQFDPAKFPSLHEIYFFAPTLSWRNSVPHFGLKKLELFPQIVSYSDDENEILNGPTPDQFLELLRKFGRIFPNVEDFYCDISILTQYETGISFSFLTIKTIRESFPGLRSVVLCGDVIPTKITIDITTKQWCILC